MILHYYHHLFSFIGVITDIYEQPLAPLDIRLMGSEEGWLCSCFETVTKTFWSLVGVVCFKVVITVNKNNNLTSI